MKELVLNKLINKYELIKREMGELKNIHKGIYNFDCEAYEIKNIGNLFFINLKALFGLMKMETTVITPKYKDLSFCNLDIVKAMGKETYMFEMYKTSLRNEDLSAFKDIKSKYSDLNNYSSEARWYDEMKLESSISKTGKKISDKAEKMLEECLDKYLILLDEAPICDPELKNIENRKYVDRLVDEGGSAVDSMTKIIGKEMTSKLIKEFMYNV